MVPADKLVCYSAIDIDTVKWQMNTVHRIQVNVPLYVDGHTLYRKEEWKRWLAFETTGFRWVLRISWTAKKTDERVLQEIDGRQ